MSAHISESKASFVGILNGVMYRFDPGAKASARGLTGFVPFTAQPLPSAQWMEMAPARGIVPVALAPASGCTDISEVELTPAEPVDQARIEKEARAAKLFKREGPEPLRAGHPELWALLVAGTSLEGGTFAAASAETPVANGNGRAAA